MHGFDDLDMKILAELQNDANLSVPKMSKKIREKSSVVYSRIKRMTRRGLIRKFTVEVDEERFGYTVSALICLEIDSKLQANIFKKLTTLRSVKKVAQITGRFDIMTEVIAKSLDELHNFVSSELLSIQGVRRAETFVVLNKNNVDALPLSTVSPKKAMSGKATKPRRGKRRRRSKAS